MSKEGIGMGGHQSGDMDTDEWLTPPWILEALGEFDLDPCAPKERPWDMAKRHYNEDDNGLFLPWDGRVWCNPPYGRFTTHWLGRCAKHRNAIALIFARTETAVFFKHVWKQCDALLFLKNRLYFYSTDGTRASANAGAPSVLIAYGSNNVEILRTCGIPGAFIDSVEVIE